MKFHSKLLYLPLSLALSGCGVLIGNQRPLVERAENYRIADLAKENSKWVRLESQPKKQDDDADEGEKTEFSDMAFRSTETEAVIALNTACRPSYARKEKDLRLFTNQLLMGIDRVRSRNEENVQIATKPALQTTLEGSLNGRNIKMKVVVLKSSDCLYDLMYLSEPTQFPKQEEEFNHFVSSLRLNKS
jgi:hypothetical protein